MKGLLALALSAALSAQALGPATARAAEKKSRYVIALVGRADGEPRFDRMREGVARFGLETGHQAFALGPARPDDAEQARIVEGLVSQKVDAICVVPAAPEALGPALKKAREAGVVVVAHQAPGLAEVDADLEAGGEPDPADTGYALGKLALALLRGEALGTGLDLGGKGYERLEVDPANPRLLRGQAAVRPAEGSPRPAALPSPKPSSGAKQAALSARVGRSSPLIRRPGCRSVRSFP